jgi:hypothetical protein
LKKGDRGGFALEVVFDLKQKQIPRQPLRGRPPPFFKGGNNHRALAADRFCLSSPFEKGGSRGFALDLASFEARAKANPPSTAARSPAPFFKGGNSNRAHAADALSTLLVVPL